MVISESQKPLTDVDVSAAEQRLQVVFPPEYREFLFKHNGGRPSPNVFEFQDPDGDEADSLVNFFFSIYEGPVNNLENKYRGFVSDERLLPHFLPIAGDPFGNLICLSVGGEDRGKVYFWDHEIEPDTAGYENMSLLANSFTEFIDMLT